MRASSEALTADKRRTAIVKEWCDLYRGAYLKWIGIQRNWHPQLNTFSPSALRVGEVFAYMAYSDTLPENFDLQTELDTSTKVTNSYNKTVVRLAMEKASGVVSHETPEPPEQLEMLPNRGTPALVEIPLPEPERELVSCTKSVGFRRGEKKDMAMFVATLIEGGYMTQMGKVGEGYVVKFWED